MISGQKMNINRINKTESKPVFSSKRNAESVPQNDLRSDHLRNLELRKKNASHVVVLLALRNGEKYLSDQLYSIKNQTHNDWSLIVSDDASSDGGRALVQCFARAEKSRSVVLIDGPNAGFAANFLHLIRRAEPSSPFVAFSDQDDAWLPKKLEHGIRQLQSVDNGVPAIYCGRTWICGPKLRKIRPSYQFQHRPAFSNAIVQNIGGGNTMIMNNAALKLVQRASFGVTDIPSHDWWTYQVVSGAGGQVIYDNEPMVLYRQHDGNVIGSAHTLFATFHRLGMVLSGQFKKWNDSNLAALNACRDVLTPENRKVLDTFGFAKAASLPVRIKTVMRSNVRHQTRLGNAGLLLATVLNRL